jgi:hypothetical protein
VDLVDLIDAALGNEPMRRFARQFVAEIPDLAKSGTLSKARCGPRLDVRFARRWMD